MKRVLLMVIDALTSRQLQAEMDNGRYPNFQRLREAGVFREQCVSIFPSITHAALASIVTGQYPAHHGIAGSHWYEVENDKVVYFSASLGVILQKGLGNFFREYLLDLNHKYLQADTVFQQLEHDGLVAASINFPLYHGDVEHKVNMPLLLQWIPGLPASTTVKGPRKLLLGDLLGDPDDLDVAASLTGPEHWFGFRDNNTIDLMLQLAKADEFPDFTLAYFPENDDRSHNEGPVAAHRELADIDEMLGALFAAYGGLPSFLQEFALIVTGDHSQSDTLADGAEEEIDLEKVLSDYQLAAAGQPWSSSDEILACPNLRAAHLYLRKVTPENVSGVCRQLLEEPRIDQVMYRAALAGTDEGYVVEGENGRLRFWLAEEGAAKDRYGNSWAWEGELKVVDGRVTDGLITFPDYPNAFERIVGALECEKGGQIWLTAKCGCEIIIPNMKSYVDGGSHASLHRLDSQPPLFVAGAPEGVDIPEFPRIIDVAPLCRAVLATSP